MSGFCIEKDMGKGKPPAFLTGLHATTVWGIVDNAMTFPTEAEAQSVIDSRDDLMGCIPMPYNNVLDMSAQG